MRYFLVILCVLSIQLFAKEQDTLCATVPSQIISTTAKLLNTSYTLKVILVQFTDVQHDPKYKSEDWTNMLFSRWIYATPNMTSPDGDKVYGSMRDYYSLMSDGEFEITGYILNPDKDNDEQPDWLTLPRSKKHYNAFTRWNFINTVKSVARDSGLDISTNNTTKLCIIYAGHMYRTGGGLHPHKFDIGYAMSEKFAMGAPFDAERNDALFAGIGTHCHEFGHLLGWRDTYLGGARNNTMWSLMATGSYAQKTHAPAPICPEYRIAKGWLTPIEITRDVTFDADYSLKDPEVFKIRSSTDSILYFLIENRSFNSKMSFNGLMIPDYNNFLPWNMINNPADLPTKGLLVWAFKKKKTIPYDPEWTYVIQADGLNNKKTNCNTAPNDPDQNYHTGDSGDPFPGFSGNKVFTPWSFPDSLDNGTGPTSYPATNVGFEIIEMGADYIKVDFYCNNPQLATPQTPWNIDSTTDDNHPAISWDANCEPDFSHYEIWKDGTLYDSTIYTTFADYGEITGKGKPYKNVHYSIKAKDSQGKISASKVTKTFMVHDYETSIPNADLAIVENATDNFQLLTNYPNPFNPTTTISYQLAISGTVDLSIYNLLGQKITTLVSKSQSAGNYQVLWNASGLASGIYIYTLTARNLQSGELFRQAKRMLLVK